MNDRNDRAIRTAVGWYNSHIQPVAFQQPILAILLTDDVASRKLAESHIPAFSVRQYVESLNDYPELIDMVVTNNDDSQSTDSKYIYDEHLSPIQISAGLKNSLLLQGTLNISTHNYLEASIIANFEFMYAGTTVTTSNIQIIGLTNINRAIHGDVVAVQVLPRNKWKRSPTAVVIEEEEAEDESEDEERDEMDVEDDTEDVMPIPTAKVVGVIKRNWRPLCGTIDKKSVNVKGGTATQYVFFWAMDRRIPKIRIRTRQAEKLLSKRIIVGIDTWSRSSRHPSGHYIKTLGPVNDKSTETEVLLLEHDVPYLPFSQAVLEGLPDKGDKWIVEDVDLKGREDLRSIDVCSIDPPGCTDIDDALHCREIEGGILEVGVHIADVSHFVKSNTPMDVEAARRGTTVYLVDKRIDMLPSLLGTNLCSLHCNVDRLAFSVIWQMTPEAEIINVRYTKSVIRSRASFTYDEAQARLDDPKSKDSISMGIKQLNTLAKKLRQKRVDDGALTLASPEVRFKMERDTNDPIEVEMKDLKDTNALVEEFMLLANISVAKHIHSQFPDSAMLRRHPRPPVTSFENLINAVSEMGFSLDVSSSKALSNSLDQAVVPSDPYFNKLIRILTTR
ncbi:exosome catalytic subunit dis3, partial [Nowakowskiella sp. JEL0078]